MQADEIREKNSDLLPIGAVIIQKQSKGKRDEGPNGRRTS